MTERRRNPRFTVEGISGNVDFRLEVDIVNISSSGGAFRAERQLYPGRKYILKLRDRSGEITLKGEVVWCTLCEGRKGPDGAVVPVYLLGMEFSDVVSEKMASLDRFIENHGVHFDQRLSGLRFAVRSPEKAVLNYPFGYRVTKVSVSGMLVETDHFFTVDDRYRMELVLKGEGKIGFVGRIASCQPFFHKKRMLYEIGVEFDQMSEESKRLLQQLIVSLENGSRSDST